MNTYINVRTIKSVLVHNTARAHTQRETSILVHFPMQTHQPLRWRSQSGPRHRNRGECPHWLRRLEATAGDQAEKIRLGFDVGPQSGRGDGLGTIFPTILGVRGAEMQRELRFKGPRQIREAELAFSHTPQPSLLQGESHLLKLYD